MILGAGCQQERPAYITAGEERYRLARVAYLAGDVGRDPDAKITKMKDGRTHLAHTAEHAVDLETRHRGGDRAGRRRRRHHDRPELPRDRRSSSSRCFGSRSAGRFLATMLVCCRRHCQSKSA